ncbi:isocitrate/isopropylmalate dehydrogenase family protein [Muricoccus radiodurans]|uniref:isocitrate/isopropylmalate dehydrogenase family protein n=1 Tax=Muricoccus radiodurans TaxID=2231721 RepID=UPI003CEA6344
MRIAVLPGDDIGPEITAAALRVLRAADARYALGLEFDEHEVGMAAHRRLGTTLPEAAMEAVRRADGILLGPGGMTLYPPVSEGGINIPGTIRKKLELYANIRPARSRPGVPKAHPGLDCVIVRENTEGFYADRSLFQGYGEFMPTPDVAMSVRLITARASRRIAEAAFRIAATRRKHVTMVGKRHVLQVTDGLFMREVNAVAEQHPDITLREIDVDAMAAEIYTRPEAFDVILTTNMFGDILSNLANALAGSLGIASALNLGEGHAAANAGHGSAPDIAGRGIANPLGLILSAALLLEHLGTKGGSNAFAAAAEAVNRAVDRAVARPETRTGDMGGTAGTEAVADALCRFIEDAPG